MFIVLANVYKEIWIYETHFNNMLQSNNVSKTTWITQVAVSNKSTHISNKSKRQREMKLNMGDRLVSDASILADEFNHFFAAVLDNEHNLPHWLNACSQDGQYQHHHCLESFF